MVKGQTMKYINPVTGLAIIIIVFAALTASLGIFSSSGPGNYEYESIRGETVTIYGKGIYRHMSADVAVQGIAQDYVTLSIGIPLLVIGLLLSRKGSLRGRFLLAGTLFYFLVTFLFYTCMGMYNYLFLAYVILLALSFFAFLYTLLSFDPADTAAAFDKNTPVRFAGGFLIVNAVLIALLWLSVVIPPLLDGSIYPAEVQHYTTLIVQGLDLGLLLPLAVAAAVLFLKRKPAGFVFAPVYIVFLTILMTSLSAKIIAMGMQGANIIPAVFLIPAIQVTAIVTAFLLLKHVRAKTINKV